MKNRFDKLAKGMAQIGHPGTGTRTVGPCNALAPQLEQVHRGHPEIEMLMISRGDPRDNRAKAKQHSMTFPIVLQQQWEISRLYATVATPLYRLSD